MYRIKCNTNAALAALHHAKRTVQKKRLTVGQCHAVVLESADSNFGSLQITHDADFAAAFLGSGTQDGSPASVIFGVTMGKVQARDIQARFDHTAQRIYVV